MKEWLGFKRGQKVKLLCETMGADHEDVEHTMPPGSVGLIDSIDRYPNEQGVAFTVWIPVDETNERGIVNSFDERDGPITNFLEAM